MTKHSHTSAIFDNALLSRAISPDVFMSVVVGWLPGCLWSANMTYFDFTRLENEHQHLHVR